MLWSDSKRLADKEWRKKPSVQDVLACVRAGLAGGASAPASLALVQPILGKPLLQLQLVIKVSVTHG